MKRGIPCRVKRTRSSVSLLPFVAALVIVIPGCGGGSSSTAPTTVPVPTPTPAPVSRVVAEGSFSGLGVRVLASVTPFTTTATGTLAVTVDWTFDSNDVDIYLTRGTDPCTVDDFNSGQCQFVGSSESFTAKPEKVSATGATSGPYTLYIGNRGPTEKAVSYQVVLTTGGGASSVSSANAAAQVELGQKAGFLSIQPRQ